MKKGLLDIEGLFDYNSFSKSWFDIHFRKLSMTTNVAKNLNRIQDIGIPKVTLWKDINGVENPYSEDWYNFSFERTESTGSMKMVMEFFDERAVMGAIGGKKMKKTLRANFPIENFLDVILPFLLTLEKGSKVISSTIGDKHKAFLVEYFMDIYRHRKELRK